MTQPAGNSDLAELDLRRLYQAGGVAALLAAILFRRNLGVEISLFAAQQPPATPEGWFELLQSNRLLALTYLGIVDVINGLLLVIVFVALFMLLRRASQGWMALALTAALLGIAVYAATNTALSMLALSEEYASTSDSAQRAVLASAGQALLAINRFGSSGAHPGSGGFVSLLMIAAAGMITSLVMLRGNVFNRATAVVGILASALDLAYCFAYVFTRVDGAVLAVTFIPAAGLFWMLWHILLGWRLLRPARAAAALTALA